MAITYKNNQGNQISIQQANETGNYIKVFTEEGISKKEFYSEGVFITTSYIVKSEQEIDAILLNISDTTFELSTTLGQYEIVEFRNYTQGVIVEKAVRISRGDINKAICFKKMELVQNILEAIYTEKYYYDQNGDKKYSFEYYSDGGACFKIYDEQDDSEIFAWDIGVNPDLTFTWQGLEYYQNAEPLLPE